MNAREFEAHLDVLTGPAIPAARRPHADAIRKHRAELLDQIAASGHVDDVLVEQLKQARADVDRLVAQINAGQMQLLELERQRLLAENRLHVLVDSTPAAAERVRPYLDPPKGDRP